MYVIILMLYAVAVSILCGALLFWALSLLEVIDEYTLRYGPLPEEKKKIDPERRD